jgi:hypothetical protein
MFRDTLSALEPGRRAAARSGLGTASPPTALQPVGAQDERLYAVTLAAVLTQVLLRKLIVFRVSARDRHGMGHAD